MNTEKHSLDSIQSKLLSMLLPRFSVLNWVHNVAALKSVSLSIKQVATQ